MAAMDTESFLAACHELLAIPSTADRPAELHRALDFVLAFTCLGFTGPGFNVDRFESGGKPSALVYRAARATPADPGRPAFRVILNAHLDVVPAPPDQFRPHQQDGRLYARGAQDMKVTALAQALAFRELAGTLPYPLGLQLVTDEESGGRDGTAHQLESGVTSQFVIIGETSGLRIVTESKGILRVTLRAAGRGAHGAYPWLGDNALVKLHRTLDKLLAAYPVPAEEAWRTTVSLARISTPNQARNQIPAEAEAWLDVRFPAGDPHLYRADAGQIAAYLGGFCEPGVTVVVDSADQPHRADLDSPEIAVLRQAARGQGYSGDFLRKHGSGDSRFYGQRGVNSVAFGTGGAGQHGPGEYADIATIEPYYRALTSFLRDLGKQSKESEETGK
jgi:succinyl-diaminopimelate desuccinylase